jgi:uncharacterized protein
MPVLFLLWSVQVSQLYIYPVKSLGGIALEQALITGRGLQYDRRYMLVDEHNIFITQRTLHKMALFGLRMGDEGFVISYEGEELMLPFSVTGEEITVTVWDDTVQATLAGLHYNEWFSRQLQQPVKLVYMHENSARPVNTRYADNGEQVSFADAYPVLLISDASLELLNSKLPEPIGMDRFRPNIVISGMQPHEEDNLTFFTINNIRFKAAKPCARCVVTTINQQTLQVSKEPLATLARYRLNDHKINFGENVICLEEGMIYTGSKLVDTSSL